MSGKLVYLLAFAVAIAVAVSGTPAVPASLAAPKANLSHNLVVGARVPGDRLVLRQSVVKTSSWLQVVTLQRTYNTTGYDKITQVRALDQKINGNGASPALLSGGPGTNKVTLLFTSKRGHGINFVVELYARRY